MADSGIVLLKYWPEVSQIPYKPLAARGITLPKRQRRGGRKVVATSLTDIETLSGAATSVF
jgi:hypothetical protein